MEAAPAPASQAGPGDPGLHPAGTTARLPGAGWRHREDAMRKRGPGWNDADVERREARLSDRKERRHGSHPCEGGNAAPGEPRKLPRFPALRSPRGRARRLAKSGRKRAAETNATGC